MTSTSPIARNLWSYCATAVIPHVRKNEPKKKGKGKAVDEVDVTPLEPHLRPMRYVFPLEPEWLSKLGRELPLPRALIPNVPLETLNLASLRRPGQVSPKLARPKPLATLDDAANWAFGTLIGSTLAALRIQDTLETERWEISGHSICEAGGRRVAVTPLSCDRPQPMGMKSVMLFLTCTPWELKSGEMVQFVRKKRFPMDTKKQAAGEYILGERFALEVYDHCVRHHTRWFVLNNVDFWCMGVFGKGWKGLYMSQVISFDSTKPTVLQMAVLWAKSALNDHEAGHAYGFPMRKIELLTADVGDGDSIGNREGIDWSDLQSIVATEIDYPQDESGEVLRDSGIIPEPSLALSCDVDYDRLDDAYYGLGRRLSETRRRSSIFGLRYQPYTWIPEEQDGEEEEGEADGSDTGTVKASATLARRPSVAAAAARRRSLAQGLSRSLSMPGFRAYDLFEGLAAKEGVAGPSRQ